MVTLRGGGNPRRIARINRTIRSGKRYKAPVAAESPDQAVKECRSAALEAARRPHAAAAGAARGRPECVTG